jgi:hypothetical protein
MRRWCVLSVEYDRQIEALQIPVEGELPQPLLHDTQRYVRRNQVMQVIAFQESVVTDGSNERTVALLEHEAALDSVGLHRE